MFELGGPETTITREAMMNAALRELSYGRNVRRTILSLADYSPSTDVRHFPAFLNRILIPLVDAYCAHYTALTDLFGEVNTGRVAFDAATASVLAAFERSTTNDELNALAAQTQQVRAMHAKHVKRASVVVTQVFTTEPRFAAIKVVPDSGNQPATLSLKDYVRVTDSAFGTGAAAAFYDGEMSRGSGGLHLPFVTDIPIERFVFELSGLLSLPVMRRDMPVLTFLLRRNIKETNAPPVPGDEFPDCLCVLASRAGATVGDETMNRFWSAVEAAVNRRFIVHMLLKNLDMYALGMENITTAAAFAAFPEVVDISRLFGIPDTILNACADEGINISFRVPRSSAAYVSAARAQQRTARTAGMSAAALLDYAKFVASLAVSARASRNIPWGVGKSFVTHLVANAANNEAWGVANPFATRFVVAHRHSDDLDFCAGYCTGPGAYSARIGLHTC
jgi:hypothetical protein